MTQKVLGPSGSPKRRRWLLAPFMLAIVAGLVFVIGAGANLPGSTFEGNDGNLVVDTAGNTDWDNAPNLSVGVDLASGGGDNSFGQGAKENNVNIDVVDGSIPNSKADLARFAVAGETIGGESFLYLAWTREDQSGTVNFDFELNAVAQPDLTTQGPKVLNRTVDDVLINYSFLGGAQNPTLTLYHWDGSEWVLDGPISSTCSEGAINTTTVADTLGGNQSVDRPPAQFGEAAINLTCAGIVPPDTCEPFASAYVKSRSSTSFNSEIKDFIAPVELQFNRCGKLTIIKHTDPGGLNQDFGYTTTGGLSPATFTLNDAGTDTQVFDPLQPGTYTVTEGDDPVGFVFESLTCVGAGGSSAGKVATAVIVGGSDITCTYINKQALGAIKVTKTTKKPGLVGPQPQSGVEFTVNGVKKTTGADGTVCFDGLVFGSYDVTETVPTGYVADGATTKSVAVNVNTSCAASPFNGNTVSFSNSPQTDVTISVDSKAPGGTDTDVNCSDDTLDFNTDDATGDGTKTSGLVTGSQTITCTIVIDP
jgi:hypothetical protein